ncbi:MAG: PfkB family carbohydrate kinase [Candidatus Eiseniibacteriota bacterium]
MSGLVAVVGTVNRDWIRAPDGTERESLGGILYNVMTLAALLEGTGFHVRAYGRIGAADCREAVRLLDGFPAADPEGLVVDPAGTNLSRLDYSGGGERVEEVHMNVAPLDERDLRGVSEADAVLVNMISGRDLSLETLARVRAASKGLFLLDVQALARTADSPRRPRSVPEWRRWCAAFDVVRGNEVEIASFPGAADSREGMRRILEAGPEEVLATSGVRGSARATRRDGVEHLERIPAFPAPGAEEPTGCGDAYLSGVCAGRLLGVAAGDAPWLGSWIAARVAGLSGIAQLTGLRGLRPVAAREVERLRGLR